MYGDDYIINVDGDVKDSHIINLCEEDFNITGSLINSSVTTKNEGIVGNENLKKARSEGKKIISVPCNEELKVTGDVTDSAIFHGKLEIDKKPNLNEALDNILDELNEIDKLLNQQD